MMTVLLTPKTIFSDYSSSGQYGKGKGDLQNTNSMWISWINIILKLWDLPDWFWWMEKQKEFG